jgi:MoaA/NifB/PqqE/SkfB family radical SAM enzyme
MIEQTHFKHLQENDTYLRPGDWPKVDDLLDHLIEKNRQGYIMVNSKAHLAKMRDFMRGIVDPWQCKAGENSCLIRTDGTVAPCFPIYSAYSIVIFLTSIRCFGLSPLTSAWAILSITSRPSITLANGTCAESKAGLS